MKKRVKKGRYRFYNPSGNHFQEIKYPEPIKKTGKFFLNREK
jgi:hypothetical protein